MLQMEYLISGDIPPIIILAYAGLVFGFVLMTKIFPGDSGEPGETEFDSVFYQRKVIGSYTNYDND